MKNDPQGADQVQPEWLKGYTPPPPPPHRGNPAWTPGCKSPNPAGRPRGNVDKRQRVLSALADDAPGVARVVINAALEGDMQACGMVLARIAPALRSQTEKVEFDFDPAAPVTAQVEAVLAAIASGVLAPDVGKMVIEAIGSLSAVRATEELAARIEALEQGGTPC